MPKVKRLLPQFKPLNYKLKLDLDFPKMTFSGEVEIEGRLPAKQDQVLLHSSELKIADAWAIQRGQTYRLKASTDQNTQQLVMDSAKTLNRGELKLSIKFSGKVSYTMHGIYQSTFEHRGKTEHIITTQFEATHAREAFPCVDEPQAKAVFELTLSVPKSLEVISNTPVQSTSQKQRQIVTFEPTPSMSTYLLAFAVGKFKKLEAKSSRGVQIRTYATPANIQHTRFALEVGTKILDFYEDYFGIPYPLEKLDLLALPDFSAGAMENWGLVTFREEVLLVDPKNTSVSTKQFVVLVIAHELAHQWFGNLVTMKWWTDLWLNEGFASWIEYLAADYLYPDWRLWTQFISNDYVRALELDALKNTHPVEVPISDPAEIRQIFDAISYSKGACVIRMLHQYLGPAEFKQGLSHYLNKYRYRNASTKDLWRALAESTGKDVVRFMGLWTQKPGYPLLSYQRTPNGYEFSQERFITSPKERSAQSSATTWPLPITFADSKQQFLMRKRKETLRLPKNYLKLNSGQDGLYRVKYSEKELDNLAGQISRNKLEPEDRMGILLDVFELNRAGYYPTERYLDLLSAYSEEKNAAVWKVISSTLADLLRVFNTADDSRVEDNFSPIGRKLTIFNVSRLGWQPKVREPHNDKLMRPIILSWASRFEHRPTVDTALELFQKHLSGQPIHPDLRSVVYGTIARTGDVPEYKQLCTLYKETDLAEEKRRLAAVLCQFKQQNLIGESLGAIKQVRLNEAPTWIANMLVNRHGKELAWIWFQKNWQWLTKSFGQSYVLGNLVNTLGDTFSDTKHYQQVKSFFKQQDFPGIERNTQQALETIDTQAQWKEREHSVTLNQLKNR